MLNFKDCTRPIITLNLDERTGANLLVYSFRLYGFSGSCLDLFVFHIGIKHEILVIIGIMCKQIHGRAPSYIPTCDFSTLNKHCNAFNLIASVKKAISRYQRLIRVEIYTGQLRVDSIKFQHALNPLYAFAPSSAQNQLV